MNTELLKQKREMLEEYFCININQEGNLTRLPVILEQHTPDMDHIPEFLLSLANDVGSEFCILFFWFLWINIFVYNFFTYLITAEIILLQKNS